jgi:hypothetical protein
MDLMGDLEEEEYYDRLISFFDDDESDDENDENDSDEEEQLVENSIQTDEQEDSGDSSDWQLVPGESDATLNFYDDDNEPASGFSIDVDQPTSPSLVAGITSNIDIQGVDDDITGVAASTREKLVSSCSNDIVSQLFSCID